MEKKGKRRDVEVKAEDSKKVEKMYAIDKMKRKVACNLLLDNYMGLGRKGQQSQR